MADKIKGLMISLGVVVLIVLAALVTAKMGNMSVLSGEYYEPIYLSGQCLPLSNNMYERQIEGHTDDPTLYHCNTQEAGTYVPINKQCEYSAEAGLIANLWKCDDDIKTIKEFNSVKSEKCTRVQGTSAIIDQGDTIMIDTSGWGVGNVKAKYPSYGIRWTASNGFKSETSNCIINDDLPNEGKDLTKKTVKTTSLVANQIVNYVQGQIKVMESGRVVSLTDVENGRPIYIVSPTKYHKIVHTELGYDYVETGTLQTDNDIKCIPRTPIGNNWCSDEAKIISKADVTCSDFSGTPGEYSPSNSGANKECIFKCVKGEIIETSDCRSSYNEDCKDKGLYWDKEAQKCITETENDKIVSTFPIEYIFIILGGIVAILLMIIVKNKMDNN